MAQGKYGSVRSVADGLKKIGVSTQQEMLTLIENYAKNQIKTGYEGAVKLEREMRNKLLTYDTYIAKQDWVQLIKADSELSGILAEASKGAYSDYGDLPKKFGDCQKRVVNTLNGIASAKKKEYAAKMQELATRTNSKGLTEQDVTGLITKFEALKKEVDGLNRPGSLFSKRYAP